MELVRRTSPAGDHHVVHRQEGEIRFGPAYYSIAVDGTELKGMTVGERAAWLNNTIYAVEEWLTTNESDGPITRLVVIDVLSQRLSRFKTVAGFVHPVSLVNDVITYRKDLGSGNGAVAEVKLSLITNWEKYA